MLSNLRRRPRWLWSGAATVAVACSAALLTSLSDPAPNTNPERPIPSSGADPTAGPRRADRLFAGPAHPAPHGGRQQEISDLAVHGRTVVAVGHDDDRTGALITAFAGNFVR